MVQVHHFPPTREDWQHQQRQSDNHSDRLALPLRSVPTHDRLLTVTQAVRDCAGIPVKEYALVAILEDGNTRLFSSNQKARINIEPVLQELRRAAGLVPDGQLLSGPHITLRYDSDKLTSTSVAREGAWTTSPVDFEASFGSQYHSGSDSRRRRQFSHVKDEDSDGEGSRRKRSKGRRGSMSPPAIVNSTRTQQLRVGDIARMEEFLMGRWRDVQQTGCKIIGKAMVKQIEPKKQTHHPYTKGDAKAPEWWPSTKGENKVRHKEPDHLLKRERVFLCHHIILLIVQPNHKQLECFRHLGLTVKKVEEFVMEKMSDFFNDPNQPKNKDKKKYLKEIFKVARQLERYYNGEIDGNTHISVMFGQDFRRNVVDYSSSDDEGSDTDADDENVKHQQRHLQAPVPALVLQSQPGYLAPGQHQPSQFEVNPMYEQPRTFESQNSMAIEHRPRNYGSPAYSQGSPAYAWTPSPNSMGNTPSNAYYTTSPQLSGPPAASYPMGPAAPSMTATLPPLQHNYEGTPRFEVHSMGVPSEALRHENMGHPAVPQVNTSFADTMFSSGQYPASSNEPMYHPQH